MPRLTPPSELAARQRAARDLRARREAAAGHQDYEQAAQLRDAEQAALTEYHRALNSWLTSLGDRA